MMLESEVNAMQCANCGAPVVMGQRFCNKCGQPVAGSVSPVPVAIPVPPPQPAPATQPSPPAPSAGYAKPSRVARHITALGLLWIILSSLRLIPGLALLVLGHTRFPFMITSLPAPMHLFLGPFLGGLGIILSGFAVAGLIAGGGLLARSPWARVLAIVVGCISLIRFPFGTALGIYTLWVLLPAESDAEYQEQVRSAGAA